MFLTWLYIVYTLIRHVLLIRSGHTELLVRSGYAAILFVTSIGPAVAKATWRHCLSHFIDRVAARTCCAVNVLTSQISFLMTLMDGSVVKHNMLIICRYEVLERYLSTRRYSRLGLCKSEFTFLSNSTHSFSCIFFYCLPVSGSHVPIIRRIIVSMRYLVYVTLCRWPSGT